MFVPIRQALGSTRRDGSKAHTDSQGISRASLGESRVSNSHTFFYPTHKTERTPETDSAPLLLAQELYQSELLQAALDVAEQHKMMLHFEPEQPSLQLDV